MPKITLHNPKVEVAESTKRYMVNGIAYVCQTFKKRLPGTQSERDAQAFFKGELEKYADEVHMEDFTLHPHAFMGFIPIAALFILVSVACYWFGAGSTAAAIVGLVLPVLAVLMFLFEFLFYREFVDIFFPKRVSRNVYAIRKPQGELQKRIIFGGHTDAANEWTYSYLGEVVALGIAIFGGVASMFIALGISIARLVSVVRNPLTTELLAGKWFGLGILFLCTIPFAIGIAFFVNYRVVADGANDNLSANYIAMSVLKEMEESGVRFANTEVWALLSGSEEAGLRGAKAFAKKHQKELSDPNVETIFIAMDTMREIEELRVCNFGCTGTVYNDIAVGDLIHEAARNCGADIPNTELYPGAVDCEAFTQYSLRANGFTAVSHEAKRYYHTRQDTCDNICPDCLGLCLNMCKEAARIFDAKGMAPYDAARAKKKAHS